MDAFRVPFIEAALPPAAQEYSGAIGAALLGLAVFVLLQAARALIGRAASPAAKGNRVLLAGPSGGGKTVMFYQLVHGARVETVPSMDPQDGECAGEEGGGAPLTDFPGHRRLRSRLAATLPQACAVVLVVDAANFNAQLRDAAELIYDMFTDPGFVDRGTHMLIACNKSDARGAKSPRFVRSKLETELQMLRGTRSSMAATGEGGGAGGDDADDDQAADALPLGREGRPFSFEIDAPCASFAIEACSALEGELEAVRGFISSVVS